MAHDSPTLEQVMDGFNRDPREFVDTPLGRMERWCAETMLIGTTKGMLNVYDTIRSDAASQAARADAEQARETLITHVCDQITELARRFDALEARLNEAEDKRRSDEQAAREAEVEDPLEDPPDIAEYQARNPPTKIGDEEHQPGGELHTLPPKSEDHDNIGDLPNELEEPPDPVPEPRGHVQPQPISISLNKGG